MDSRQGHGTVSGRRRTPQLLSADELALLAKLLGIISPAVATALLFLARDAPQLLWWAMGILMLSVLIQISATIWDRRLITRDRTLNNVLHSQLAQMASMIAVMPGQRGAEHHAVLRELARQAVMALVLVFRKARDVRAVIYSLDPDGGELSVLRYEGLRQPLGAFRAGDGGRGDRALMFLLESGVPFLFVPDIRKERPEDYLGSGNGYRTFISAPISCDPEAYGMLTVDAARPGDLIEDDVQVVRAMAKLLAVAFALIGDLETEPASCVVESSGERSTDRRIAVGEEAP